MDFDATDDPTHGDQEESYYHGYFEEHIYHPLLVFDAADDPTHGEQEESYHGCYEEHRSTTLWSFSTAIRDS